MAAHPDAVPLQSLYDPPPWWFKCKCGYRGKAGELLCEDNINDNNTLYCPKCKAAAWEWA